ncbi:peptidoglycan DD-metalloendopeptidase family protein [Marmoricola sp. RAF53]|uniref:peptidoglycan DD-metalloendopeptidase family protein n=1 Tax=Marmoricola sp. RAF53 TaxID=3233059 RepID=UPI003F9C8AF2
MARTLPRTTRHRVTTALVSLCALAVASGAVPFPNAQADDLHDKKHKVQQGIQDAQGDLEDSSAALIAATTRLRTAQTQLDSAQRTLAATEGQLTAARVLDAQMQARLAQAVAALEQAQAEVEAGKAKVVEQRGDIGRLAAADYQYGDPRLLGLSMVLTSQDPVELASQLNTVDNLMDRENRMYADLQATEVLLRVQAKKVAAAKQAVAEQRQAAAVNLAHKQALEQAAVANRARVVALVGVRRNATVAAARARAADARKLRQLKKEEARIRALIIQRAKHSKGGYSGDTGGFLRRPVDGYVTSPFGWRKHPIYGYWGLHNGVDFHAPCGTPEMAGAEGTVISEYYSDVWGNRLILDVGKVNGKAMTLIYNHISSYKVGNGARVSRGQTVALAGTTGWSTACHLHFTVMLDGTAVDPMKFF